MGKSKWHGEDVRLPRDVLLEIHFLDKVFDIGRHKFHQTHILFPLNSDKNFLKSSSISLLSNSHLPSRKNDINLILFFFRVRNNNARTLTFISKFNDQIFRSSSLSIDDIFILVKNCFI